MLAVIAVGAAIACLCAFWPRSVYLLIRNYFNVQIQRKREWLGDLIITISIIGIIVGILTFRGIMADYL